MTHDPLQHHRRSVRLQGYNYARPGWYFVTICTEQRALFFEDIVIRSIAEQCWAQIPDHFPGVELDEWVVMPNHIHGIIAINVGGGVQNEGQKEQGVQLNAPTSGFTRPEDPGDNRPHLQGGGHHPLPTRGAVRVRLATGLPRPHHPR